MKIKEICILTGLTDKTVRFYIENELITPEYTENYLGRRSFTFDEKNLEDLKDISTLRKAGFSVAQIKEIQRSKERSSDIIKDIIETKKKQIEENSLITDALDKLDLEKSHSVKEIAEALREPVKNIEVEQEDTDVFCIIFKWAKLIMIAVCCIQPLYSFFGLLFDAVSGFSPYFTVRNKFETAISCIFAFLPFIIFVASLTVKKLRKIKRYSYVHNGIIFCILLVYSVCVYPFIGMYMGLVPQYCAQTNSPYDYLEFTLTEDFDYEAILQVFPKEIPDSVLTGLVLCSHEGECDCNKPKYLYFNDYDWDGAEYEIFAEWSLPETDFYGEIARINGLNATEYIDYGDYKVKIFKNSEDDMGKHCLVFAYNENSRTVRYIFCSGLSDYETYLVFHGKVC